MVDPDAMLMVPPIYTTNPELDSRVNMTWAQSHTAPSLSALSKVWAMPDSRRLVQGRSLGNCRVISRG